MITSTMEKKESKPLEKIKHTLDPIYDKHSKILILGTMPSPESRRRGFYYMHPQNRFWRVISELLHIRLPNTNEERKALLLQNHIALWDVLDNCEIDGARDSSIKSPVANDLHVILDHFDIKSIFTTGKEAEKLYNKLCLPKTCRKATALPSTSAANARFSFDDLLKAYQVLLKFLKDS